MKLNLDGYETRTNEITFIPEVNVEGHWLSVEALTYGPVYFGKADYLKMVGEEYSASVTEKVSQIIG